MSAFSVLTTPTISPRFTRSPGLTLHSIRVPSSMSAPRLGIRNSAMHAHHGFYSGDDGWNLREGSVLEMLGIWRGRFNSADLLDRRIQIVEGFLLDTGADLRGDSTAAPAFVHNERAVSSSYRLQESGIVERPQCAQIDHFRFDAFLCQALRSVQTLPEHSAISDDRDITAGATHTRPFDIHWPGINRQ